MDSRLAGLRPPEPGGAIPPGGSESFARDPPVLLAASSVSYSVAFG